MAFAPAVSIVTGGASGIGRSLVERLVARGGRVVVADRDEAAATAVADRLGSRVRVAPLDVAGPGAVARLVAQTVERESRLDPMANNAGILLYGPADEIEDAHWDRAIAVNLRAVIDGSQAALVVMAPGAPGRSSTPVRSPG